MPQANPDLLLLQQRGYFKTLPEGLSGISVPVTHTQYHMCDPTPWQCRDSLPGQTAAMRVCGTGLSLPRSLPRSLLRPRSDLQGKEESSPAAPPA